MAKQNNEWLKNRNEIIDEILEPVVGKTKEAVKFLINSSLFARQDRVAAPKPPPNQNGTASNEIGDGDGGVNNEMRTYIIQKTYSINTLVAPFIPEAVLPRPDYSMTKQNCKKLHTMEPKPNNSSTAYDEAVKLRFIPKVGTETHSDQNGS